MCGVHNLYNALASIAIGLELEVPFDPSPARWRVTGVTGASSSGGRRGGVLVVDDYGHHPTEIRATLVAAKLGSTGRRMVVLFQPHRYTRTQDLMDEFARSFNNADVLMLTDIYAASEDPIEGVSAETLVEAVQRFGHKDVRYVGSVEEATQALFEEVRPGDIVLTLGAGKRQPRGRELAEILKRGQRLGG